MKRQICIYGDRTEIAETIANQLSSDFSITIKQPHYPLFGDILNLHKFDLIHTSNLQSGLFVCLMAKLFFKTHYSITLNGLAWIEFQEMPFFIRLMSHLILWIGLQYTDHLFPLTNFTKHEYLKKFPFLIKKEITIPYLPYTPLQLCFKKSFTGHQIITVTSFKYWRKCFPLLNLKPILENLPKHYKFLIIGKDGPYRKVFEKLYINEPRVKILSNVKNIHSYYCKSRIYLHYSNLDTLGRSILEAELIKLPCVVVKGYNGSSEAILGQAVKNTPLVIAKAILKKEKQSNKESELIVKWVKTKFSPLAVAKRYKKGFLKVLN